MTNDELLAKLDYLKELAQAANDFDMYEFRPAINALRAIVELHKPINYTKETYPDRTDLRDVLFCPACTIAGVSYYPCSTIQAIEKELK